MMPFETYLWNTRRKKLRFREVKDLSHLSECLTLLPATVFATFADNGGRG